MEIMIIITLGVFLIVTGYTTFNLLRKSEKQEDIIKSQDIFISKLTSDIQSISDRLSVIDQKGAFSSDDEIGWFFTEVKFMKENLEQYIGKQIEDGKNQEKEKTQTTT